MPVNVRTRVTNTCSFGEDNKNIPSDKNIFPWLFLLLLSACFTNWYKQPV